MKIDQLVPAPSNRLRFAWSHHIVVPEQPGCYALVTYAGEVLYVGLASKSVRDRIRCHLDAIDKRAGASAGLPFWIYYLLLTSKEVGSVEKGWMNASYLSDGALPPLNHVFSPE